METENGMCMTCHTGCPRIGLFMFRGITSITDAEESFTVTVRFALVLLPLMVLATAVIGYRFTRRTLAPVRQITDTVRQIRADADLSRRIGFEEVKRNGRPMPDDGGSDEETGERRKKGDEIYILGRTFDEMLEELEEVFRREQQFTSDASHELRTPVSVIMAQCDAMLAEGNSFTEEQRNQIGLIQRKARGMADMISQLLFLSRADQGRQPLNKERINISELTEMIAEEQQMLADADGRGIHIETQICPEIWADVDETFYIRMLVNLISNALRYSRENGLVEVSLEQDGGSDHRKCARLRSGNRAGRAASYMGTVFIRRKLRERTEVMRTRAFHGEMDCGGSWRKCLCRE